jgi:hypothetical protein
MAQVEATIRATRLHCHKEADTFYLYRHSAPYLWTSFFTVDAMSIVQGEGRFVILHSPAAGGETFCITGVTRNPDMAKEVIVSFAPFEPVDFNGTTEVLSLRVLTRIGTNGTGAFCGGHSNAVGLRLYFDAVSQSSQLDATIEP